MRKFFKIFVIIVVLLVCFEGVIFSAGQQEKKKGQITIGILFDFLQVERRVIAKNYLEQYAKEYNLDLIFLDANGDEKVQLQQAENLITQGVDVMVLLPQNSDACQPIIDQAREAGIPLIVTDRMISNADLDYFVGMNNDVIGDLMAGYVYEKVSEGNYVLINGAPQIPILRSIVMGG